jgi:uncharacterized protein YceH (UPF0502 family)
MQLNTVEARVVGCLIEKELTTPDYYPLTMNALVTACNQSLNRDPVVDYDEGTVERGIESLRDKSLVRWVKEVRSRTPKYRHDVESVLRLDIPHRSLLAVLLLRGPQTAGELRTRTDRYCDFDDLEQVEQTLREMAGRETPLLRKLERRPGQKEARWLELLSEALPVDLPSAAAVPADPPPHPAPAPVGGQPEPETTSDLEALVRELQERVARLERELGLD